MITTDWHVTDTGFSLAVHIPVNTTATISLPGNTDLLEVGSGDYRFEVRPINKMNR
jgi:hypothetical protein